MGSNLTFLYGILQIGYLVSGIVSKAVNQSIHQTRIGVYKVLFWLRWLRVLYNVLVNVPTDCYRSLLCSVRAFTESWFWAVPGECM